MHSAHIPRLASPCASTAEIREHNGQTGIPLLDKAVLRRVLAQSSFTLHQFWCSMGYA